MNNINDWFDWILGVLMALLMWLGKITHKKASESVSREELRATFKELQDERRQMHVENKETLSRIHDRIDEVYRHMNFRRD